MRRTAVLTALLAVPLLIATAYSAADAATSSSPATDHGPSVLTLSATPRGESALDNPPHGPGVGDEHFETGVLLDSRGHRAGSYALVGQLVAMDARSAQEQLTVTLHLAHGDVITLGSLPASDNYTLAVVGGTVDYSAAGGTLAVRGSASPYTFTLTLEH